MPAWLEYDPRLLAFIKAAGQDVWIDRHYHPSTAHTQLHDHAFVAHAALSEIKTLLTLIVRGERFCDGHWAEMVREGHVRRVLERLRDLASQGT